MCEQKIFLLYGAHLVIQLEHVFVFLNLTNKIINMNLAVFILCLILLSIVDLLIDDWDRLFFLCSPCICICIYIALIVFPIVANYWPVNQWWRRRICLLCSSCICNCIFIVSFVFLIVANCWPVDQWLRRSICLLCSS